MVAPKTKRKDLQAPEWLVEEWKTGNKAVIARVLQEENFDKVSCLHVALPYMAFERSLTLPKPSKVHPRNAS